MPKKSDSSLLKRHEAVVLSRAGFTQQQIANSTGLTLNQVRYAIFNPGPPKPRTGRKSKLTDQQVDELVKFISSSKQARQMSYTQLDDALGLNVGEYCIRHALRKRGFARHTADAKYLTHTTPLVSEKKKGDECSHREVDRELPLKSNLAQNSDSSQPFIPINNISSQPFTPVGDTSSHPFAPVCNTFSNPFTPVRNTAATPQRGLGEERSCSFTRSRSI